MRSKLFNSVIKTRTKYFFLSLILGFQIFASLNVFAQSCPTTSRLESARNFAVLGGSAVTNTGATEIIGNLGVSPGSSISGLASVTIDGEIHEADAVATQAQVDITNLYNSLTALPFDFDLTGLDLGTLVLTPGVYRFSSSAQLTGTLTLNTLGDPEALFIFQIGSTLTTASGSLVNVIGGSTDNIFWAVGSSATFGTTTTFAGNVLAYETITLNTGASMECGRAFARTGAVTLDSAYVEICNQACLIPICGDEIIQSGEECDDANSEDNDACNNSCLVQIQDCAGTYAGDAIVDHCGVCEGDGLSCLACVETDNISRQLRLDANAAQLRRLVLKATQDILQNDGDSEAFVRRIRRQARNLQILNWQLIWSLPAVANTCEENIYCEQISNADLLESFRLNTKSLSRLVTQSVQKLRDISDNETIGNKYIKAAKRQVILVNNSLDQIPTSDTLCSAP